MTKTIHKSADTLARLQVAFESQPLPLSLNSELPPRMFGSRVGDAERSTVVLPVSFD